MDESRDHSPTDQGSEAPDEPLAIGTATHKPTGGTSVSGLGGRDLGQEDRPDIPSARGFRVDNAAPNDGTGQSEKPEAGSAGPPEDAGLLHE
jgi:hypothetical protein